MKVGIVVDKFNPKSGGGFTFQESLLNELISANNEHSFTIFYQGNKNLASIRDNQNFQFIHLGKLFRIVNILSKYTLPLKRKIYRGLKFFRILKNHIVLSPFDKIASKNNIQLLWFLSPAYLYTDIPYLYTVWDLQHRLQPYFPETSQNGEWDWREHFFSNAIRKASFLLTGTEEGKKEIIQFYGIPEERIKKIPFPTPQFALDCKHNQSVFVPSMQLPEKYIFYPAQFWAHKNHINLLLGLKFLSDHHHLKINAVFAGKDYGTRQYISKKIIELGLREQVQILDFVSREDLIGLYQHAFALVYVSHFGPDNLPPLEAFALGCPVIASRVPGADEQLGDNVLFVNPSEPSAISNAIKKFHDDADLRQKLKESGLKRAELYTSKEYISSVLEIINGFEKIRNCWE